MIPSLPFGSNSAIIGSSQRGQGSARMSRSGHLTASGRFSPVKGSSIFKKAVRRVCRAYSLLSSETHTNSSSRGQATGPCVTRVTNAGVRSISTIFWLTASKSGIAGPSGNSLTGLIVHCNRRTSCHSVGAAGKTSYTIQLSGISNKAIRCWSCQAGYGRGCDTSSKLGYPEMV